MNKLNSSVQIRIWPFKPIAVLIRQVGKPNFIFKEALSVLWREAATGGGSCCGEGGGQGELQFRMRLILVKYILELLISCLYCLPRGGGGARLFQDGNVLWLIRIIFG